MHPEPGSKIYAKGPHWRVCEDEVCTLQHVVYEPFRPVTGQEIDLSYLEPTSWGQKANKGKGNT